MARKKGKKKGKTTKSAATIADASMRAFVADVPIKNLKLIKGFNPRTDLEDLEDLEQQIVAAGNIIKDPLEVRPVKVDQELDADGKYEIIDGHRRFELAKKLGIENVNIFASVEYHDENKALAEAIVKNDGDVDHPLHPIDLANAVGALKEKTGLKQRALSKLLGWDKEGVKVGRCLQVAGLPEPVKADCRAGKVTYNSLLTVAKLNDKVQKKIIPDLVKDGNGMTPDEINARARDIAAEEGMDARKNPRAKRSEGSRSSTANPEEGVGGPKPRPKKQIHDMAHQVIGVIETFEEENAKLPEDEQLDVDIWHSAMAGLMFCLGMVDKLDIHNRAYNAAYKKIKKEYDTIQKAKAKKEEGKKKSAKKKTAGKKGKKKSAKKKTAGKKGKKKATKKKGKGKKAA